MNAAAGPRRLLALGDSYTVAEGIDPAGQWPRQLAGLLRAQGLQVGEPLIVARTGWTTDELDAGLDAAAPRGPFDLVSLAIGVNDQYRGRDVDGYRTRFEGLLRRTIGLAGGEPGQVLVLSIPDWGRTPFAVAGGRDAAAIGAQIDAFNAAAHAVCRARGAAFVDVTASSRAAHAPDDLAADGLHYAAGEYARWAALALPAARAALA
ncbi:MAG: GDSL-type esterase/lipase family protein [Pseudoxanthomonas sp.]